MYTAELKMGDKVISGEGETLTEAISKLEKPSKIMAKGSLTISDGEKKNTIVMFPARLRRLFMNKGFLQVQSKILMMGMK